VGGNKEDEIRRTCSLDERREVYTTKGGATSKV
jgi:hypothetical protein